MEEQILLVKHLKVFVSMANLRHLTLQRPFCSLTTGSNPIPTRTQAMSSGSNERMFQLKYDPVTGMSEWVVVEGGDNHNDNVMQPSSSIDLGTTSYLDMLNDNRRNKAYRLAIDKTVTRPCCVLDIGYCIFLSNFEYFELVNG